MKLRICAVFALGAVLACSKTNVVNTTNNNTFNNITQVVGSMGARLESPGGAILDIPPGAVVVETELSVGEVSPDEMGVPTIPDMRPLQSPIFALEPHGQTFADDITITLPHMITDPNRLPEVWRADPGGTWQKLETLATPAGRIQVTSRTFSYYVVLEFGSDDQDGDGYTGDDDCDENDPQKNIAAAEICDGLDNNCNGSSDEVFTGDTSQPLPITGEWTDNFGSSVSITSENWGDQEIIDYDQDWIITKSAMSDVGEMDNPFNRIVWVEEVNEQVAEDGRTIITRYLWFCTIDYGLAYYWNALCSSKMADSSDPSSGGCGDSPWIQMTKN